MKRAVLSSVSSVCLTIGLYAFMLWHGLSQGDAVGVTIVVTLLFAFCTGMFVPIFGATTGMAGATALFCQSVLCIEGGYLLPASTLMLLAVIATSFSLVAFAHVLVEKLKVNSDWGIIVIAVQSMSILSALYIGFILEGIAIAAVGCAVILLIGLLKTGEPLIIPKA